mgnify:CR=1 FL=1
MQWLKVDVVQYAHRIESFAIYTDPLPLPSLLGVAFTPASGFAFLPEQLVGLDLVDEKQRFAVSRVGEPLLEEKRWPVGAGNAVVMRYEAFPFQRLEDRVGGALGDAEAAGDLAQAEPLLFQEQSEDRRRSLHRVDHGWPGILPAGVPRVHGAPPCASRPECPLCPGRLRGTVAS